MSDLTSIICPNCKTPVSLDEALTHQLEEKITEKLLSDQKKDREDFEKELRAKLSKEAGSEVQALQATLQEKEKHLEIARKAELDLRLEKNKLDDERKAFELDKQRQLDVERQKIQIDAKRLAEEDMRMRILEKEKQLQDAMKANMELQRKLQQGSQQTQGEVLELVLEDLLRSTFPRDTIEPVPKGINGFDIKQTVYSPGGQPCGTMAWESKYTKAWSDGWVQKLKDDQRKVGSDVAILVSEVLPKDIQTFGYREGVWVCDQKSIVGVATVLRMYLIRSAAIKQTTVGKNEKMEVLYSYLTGSEFRHKMEAIVEAFVSMKSDLEKEKRVMMRIWAKREKEIEQIVANTASMHGDFQGLLGSSIQSIPALESGFEEIEESS